MGALIRSRDWSQTPLGAVENWSQSLKTSVRLILGSRYPMFVWWGQELTKFYNDAYIPVLGKRHPQALGQPASEVWAEIWDTLGPQTAAVLNQGRSTWNRELLLIMERNGYPEETYFTFSYSPVAGDGGGVGGVFCACSEDTQRVLGERRLATLRELAAETVAAKTAEAACEISAAVLSRNCRDIPFALFYLKPDDRSCARLAGTTGLAAGTIAAPESIELASAQTSDKWQLQQAIETGETRIVTDLEAQFGLLPGGAWPQSPSTAAVMPLMRSGETFGILIVGVSPLRVLNDDCRGFFDLVAGQVTTAIANARASEQERKRAETLAELDRAKTAFFSNVSHEFRTPLTLMLGPIEDALADRNAPLPAQHRERIEVVHRNGLRLLKLVNTLLDFSRIEAGRIEAVYEPTDLAAFTAELASVFRSAIEQASLRLCLDCPPLPEAVWVDRQMWEKIVLNLLSNAFKFTFKGEIAVLLRSANNQIELEVRDTGTGIPAEDLPRIFERFHRVRGAAGRSYEGSGIGLSLVQELVRLHGGSVRVSSEIDRGTSFTVSIPAGCAHLPPRQLGSARALTSTATAAASYAEEAWRWLPEQDFGLPVLDLGLEDNGTELNPNPKSKILLVDDNADMRLYLQRLLLEGGYAVETAADGILALAAALKQPPDLVLSDVMMPRLDGFGLLRELRANPTTRDIPIVLLSARAGVEAQLGGLSAGADDYLTKPFSARELLARVEVCLQQAKFRREAAQREQALRLEAETARNQVESILSSIGDGFFVLDCKWRYTYTNDRNCELAGMQREQMLGHTVWELFPDVVDTEAYIQFDRALKQQTPVQFEYFYPAWQRWFEYRVYPGASGVSVFAADITDRKRIEQELQQREQQFRTSIENTPDIAIRYDRELRLLYVSPCIEQAIGLRAEQCIGKTAIELGFTAPPSPAWHAALQAVFETGQSGLLEIAFPNPAGELRTYQIRCVPELIQEQQIKTVLAVARDVTAYKQSEEALRRSNERFQAAMRAVDGIVFEWNLPANTVYRSEGLFDLVGVAAEDADPTPQWWQERIHPDDLIRLQSKLPSIWAADADRYQTEYRVRHQDGSWVDLWERGCLQRNQQGEMVGIVGFSANITDRKLATAALQESEERFRTLADNISQFAWMAHADGSIFWYNQRWFDYTGTARAEMQGWGCHQVQHPEHADRVTEHFRRCIAAGEPWEDTFPLRSADGTYRWFLSRAIPIRDAKGRILRWFGTNTDITEVKQAETALRNSEQKFRNMADNAPFMVWVTDPTGCCTYLSQSWYDFTGQAKESSLGFGWLNRTHPDDREYAERTFLAANERREAFRLEYRLLRSDGEYIWAIDAANPRFGADGQFQGYVGSVIDISDRKQAEAERDRLLQQEQAARLEAENANRIKDEFLAVLSHELRSPLNPILGWAKLLQSGRLDAQKTKNALETIERNAKLQTQLIEDLLDVSRILQGKLVLHQVPVTLAATAAAALETVRLAAEAKGIHIQKVLEIGEGKILGDSARLQQVIWNLLSNAIKFTPPGGTVEIRLQQIGTDAQIQVVDSGKGIKPEFLPYVFECFRQEDGTTTRKFGGLGLGLAIVRYLTELHGGTVGAQSPGEGLGATFTVRLPLIPASPQTPPDDAPVHSTLDLARLQILVVDDEPDIRDIVSFILEDAGAAVRKAASAAEALSSIEQFLPDVLICDVGMPEMDGYMLMRLLRGRSAARGGQIPAIALTAYAGEVDRQSAIAAGFGRHLPKPVAPDELVAAVKLLVESGDN